MTVTNVLHVVESSGGGVLSVVFDSISVLNRAFPGRFNFTIAFSRRAETPCDLIEQNPHINFVELNIGRVLFSVNDLRVAAQIATLSRTHDVIHCHSSRAGFVGRASRIFFSRGRILYTPHCYAFLATDFSGLKRRAIYMVERLLALLPNTFTVACGDSEFALAKELNRRACLVRNGYNATQAQCVEQGSRGNFTVVGSGRHSVQKDPDLFLEIASRLDISRSRFRWIGGLPNADIATGWLPRHEAVNVLQGGDVFLMTSRWEGLPMTGLEAMAFGKPLVVRDAPGARDLVSPGVNGFLFKSADEAASYLRMLSKHDDLRLQMGEMSRRMLREKFSEENYLRLAELYAA